MVSFAEGVIEEPVPTVSCLRQIRSRKGRRKRRLVDNVVRQRAQLVRTVNPNALAVWQLRGRADLVLILSNELCKPVGDARA